MNGRGGRELRNSAATRDVSHPWYVSPEDYRGDRARIKQVVKEHSVCLPPARVVSDSYFGTLKTEAAVSKHLSQHYPHLLSNKSKELLRQKGERFSEETMMTLTLSMTRALETRVGFNL